MLLSIGVILCAILAAIVAVRAMRDQRSKGKGAITSFIVGIFTGGFTGAFLLVMLGIASLFFIGGDSEIEKVEPVASESQIPTPDLYTVVSDKTKAPYKRTIEVTLHQRLDEDQLASLAKHLKAQETTEVERTFIGYRLDSQDPGTAYWATTHYDPDLAVNVIGMTPSESDTFDAYDPDAHYQNVIGSWTIERGFNYISVAYSKDGQIYIDDVFPGEGTNSNEYEASRTDTGGIRLQKPDDSFGEYFVISPDGDLEFWSENGNYFTAAPRDPSKIDLSSSTLNS